MDSRERSYFIVDTSEVVRQFGVFLDDHNASNLKARFDSDELSLLVSPQVYDESGVPFGLMIEEQEEQRKVTLLVIIDKEVFSDPELLRVMPSLLGTLGAHLTEYAQRGFTLERLENPEQITEFVKRVGSQKE